MANSAGLKLRILMLHGFTQSGHLFEIKTKALKKSLEKAIPPAPQPGHLPSYPGGIELVYTTAPIRLDARDVPGFEPSDSRDAADSPEMFAWWRRKGDKQPFRYEGIEIGLGKIAQVLENEGPFTGVLGFSQGGGAVGMVTSLLETGRREAFDAAEPKGGMHYPDDFTRDSESEKGIVHPPLKFGVAYSGFAASDANAAYLSFYEPPIKTPILHVLGSLDTVVSEERSLRLVNSCVDGRGQPGSAARLVYHPGGHTVPSQKQYVNALVAFIREAVGEGQMGSSRKQGQEESVEDMDVPF